MKKLFVLFIIIGLILAGVFIWWNNGLQPVNAQDTKQQIFVVRNGEGIKEIGYSLKNHGFIKDPIVFFLFVKTNGLDGKIQAGDFKLSPSMKTEDIAQALTHGILDIWVTIPEGKRADEINEILAQKDANYASSWKQQLESHEGYLFPDTYLLPHNADITNIIDIMIKNFDQKYSSIPNTLTGSYSKQQLVTIASLVEREAKFSTDRPLVASVIYNRLKTGMPLQIDATVQYALGYDALDKTWWKKNLTQMDLQITSPYNTYSNPGLPPTPIANPGISALQAAVNPTQTNYLYYVSDHTGHLHFAETLDQHNANIAKYSVQ